MTDTDKAAERRDILIADDMPENLEVLTGMLKKNGCRVRVAVNGELALRAARGARPDLILLDIKMPGLDGFEVCAALKADEKLRDVPVIFLSCLGAAEDKVRAFRAGCVDYITKPFNFEEVSARVETQLRLMEQKRNLQRSYDKLRELEKMRDSLVHMIAHDLRSPLTGIYASLHFLQHRAAGLPADAAENVDDALKSVSRMVRMISDMLDASKLESGRMKLRPEDFDLGALAREALDGLKPLVGGRAVGIDGDGAPLPVRADRELAGRVLQNLVGNAIKFTPEEGGRIVVRLERSGRAARVSVENNGPDIPPEYQEKIFEKFGQVETGAGRRGYSTGLGLNFCKLAVEAHGGRIGVLSPAGGPTVFWFELPAAAAAPAAPAPGGAGTVLVVDDDELIRRTARRVLAESGYEVLEAADAAEARRLCREGARIDLLLADMVMPEMTGSELYKDLAGSRPGLAVVFMSGHSGEVLEEADFMRGTDAFLQKPFSAEALTDAVRRALAKTPVA